MKFKQQALYLKTNARKLLQTKHSLLLTLTVIVPILLNTGITFSLIKHFSLSSKTTEEYIVKQSQNQINEQMSLHLNEYLSQKNNFNISLQDIKKVLHQIDLDSSLFERTFILKENGSIVASKQNPKSSTEESIDREILDSLKELFDDKASERVQSFNFVIEQQNFFGQVTPLPNQKANKDRSVIIVIPKSKLISFQNKKYSKQRRDYLAYLLPSILLGIGTYIYFTRVFSRVNKTAWKISQKNNESEIDEVAVAPLTVLDRSIEQTVERQPEWERENNIVSHCLTSSLLADMGHELRSPLNAILGLAQIMQQESSLTQLQLENMMIINHSGNRMLSNINDLVDLSKIETGRPILEENSFDFYLWLDKIERLLRHKAHSKGLEISLVRHSSLPQYIRADEARLSQIVTNLIEYLLSQIQTELVTVKINCNCDRDNFAASTPTQDRSSSRQEISFTVGSADFSISPSELVNLFSPAVSVRQRNTQENSSLCLPISRRLAQLMGGDISIRKNDSSEGNIVDFRLNIQAQIVTDREVQIQSTPRKVAGLASAQSNCRILVVDDSKTNRKIMVQLLERVGFEIQEAVNGKEAVEAWLRWQPHMIWMDIQMPVMNGYEATNQIKSDSKHVSPPIVAISASSLDSERSLLQASRCDDFVAKPFSEGIVFDKIAQHLGVRYVYQSTSTPSDSIRLTSDVLTKIMPRQWLNQLEQAATALDADLLTQLLQEIPAHHSSLKEVLQLQVDNFDFERIIDLAQQGIDIETNDIG